MSYVCLFSGERTYGYRDMWPLHSSSQRFPPFFFRKSMYGGSSGTVGRKRVGAPWKKCRQQNSKLIFIKWNKWNEMKSITPLSDFPTLLKTQPCPSLKQVAFWGLFFPPSRLHLCFGEGEVTLEYVVSFVSYIHPPLTGAGCSLFTHRRLWCQSGTGRDPAAAATTPIHSPRKMCKKEPEHKGMILPSFVCLSVS